MTTLTIEQLNNMIMHTSTVLKTTWVQRGWGLAQIDVRMVLYGDGRLTVHRGRVEMYNGYETSEALATYNKLVTS